MDWGRAKTILILSFLCLNLFLGYQLWEDKKKQGIEGQITQLQIDELKQRLQEESIRYTEESISEEIPEMSNMKVLKWENQQLEVIFNQPISLPNNLTEAERNALYQSQITYFDQYQLDTVRSTSTEPVYMQRINDHPVFTSQLQILLGDQVWNGYRQSYYIPEEQGASRKVVSAYTTLAVLLDNGLLTAGEEVKQIKLGYYIEQLDADVQFLVPAWRVIHTNGIHFVNGFTGMVIGVSKNE